MLFSLALLGAVAGVRAVENGLARTPQLGWNSWNAHGCDVNEQLVLDSTEALVKYGFRDVGYNYVVLDDCWSDGRDSAGKWKVDLKRFPHGMKWLAKQIHDQDLLYGMYSSAGELTCGRYAGSLDHEVADANSLASWDVDYLKYDNCYHMGRMGTAKLSYDRYDAMSKALNSTKRPILYSLCNWGEDYVHTWGSSIANSWRISGDIYDSFSRPNIMCSCTDPADPHCVAPGTHCSVLRILNRVAPYVDRGLPGGWNDLDMLEVGNGGMTDGEYVAHFSLWAALKSPLLIGADMRTLDAKALTIMNNPAVLAVSQDPLGASVQRMVRTVDGVPKDRWGVGETQVWSGPLANGDQLVIFLNVADKDVKMEATPEDIFLLPNAPQCSETWDVHDLWADRMSDAHGQRIVDAARAGDDAARDKVFEELNWFNVTAEGGYAAALKRGDERLFGKKVGTLDPKGKLKFTVPRHEVKVLRLKGKSGGGKRYNLLKDEL